jgi:hypothetical protein
MSLHGWKRSFARLPTMAVAALVLAGCEGTFTADLATEAPADPDIVTVRADLAGLEFETAGGGTKTLAFRVAETVDLMDLTEGTPLRLFTDERLPAGDYTGIRLLFDAGAGLNVARAAGGQFDGKVAEGEFAEVDFSVEDGERSREALTLSLDLRRSLVFEDASDEYTLTPVLRAVRTSDAALVRGNVLLSCPTGSSMARNGAVYAFAGSETKPDDVDGTGVEPVGSSRVRTDAFGLLPRYELRFLAAGDYTLAVTCRGDADDPSVDDELGFRGTTSVRLAAGAAVELALD